MHGEIQMIVVGTPPGENGWADLNPSADKRL